MLKKITWQEGSVISLKLTDSFYTLVQMRRNYYLQFFNLIRDHDNWTDINLEKTDTLFFQFASTKALKGLAVSKLTLESVSIDKRTPQKKCLGRL